MAASPHSWDFLLLRLRELRLPLLRGSASRTPGPTAKSIADIPPCGGWVSKLLFAAHRVLLAAMFSLFYASRAVARDAELTMIAARIVCRISSFLLRRASPS